MIGYTYIIVIFRRKVGPKGQIVIPKDIRDLLNINPGSEVVIELNKKGITIRPAENTNTFLKNFFKTSKKLPEKVDFKKILDEQYE